MSRWQDDIRRRLSDANLDPAREAEIAQELEQHLEDRYDELRAIGHSDDDARRMALDELREERRMREELARTVTRAPAVEPPGVASPGWRLATVWQDVGWRFGRGRIYRNDRCTIETGSNRGLRRIDRFGLPAIPSPSNARALYPAGYGAASEL